MSQIRGFSAISFSVLLAAACSSIVAESRNSSPIAIIESTNKPTALADLPPTWTPDTTSTNTLWPSDTPTVTLTPYPTPLPTDPPTIILSQLVGENTPLIKSKLVYAGYINDQLEILSLSEGSSDPELVIQSTLDDIFPIWSPDGKSLAFLRTGSFSTFHLRDPKTDLYLLLDQTLINFTVEMNLFISEMVWSPNSKYIAFSAHDKEPEPLEDDSLNIYIVDINTRQIAKITDTSGVGCRSISWSPDSRELVSACRGGMVSGLIITNRDGSNLWFTELWAVDGVEWLPSGNSLSFTGGWDPLGSLRAEYMRQRGAQEDNGYFSWYERLESLDFQQKPIHAFGWFPADDNLFLIQSEDLIQIVDLSQQQVISILGDYHDLEGQFTWGPDGQQIAFAYFDGHDAEIGILNLKTLLFSKLTDNLVDDLMPSWQPLLGN